MISHIESELAKFIPKIELNFHTWLKTRIWNHLCFPDFELNLFAALVFMWWLCGSVSFEMDTNLLDQKLVRSRTNEEKKHSDECV